MVVTANGFYAFGSQRSSVAGEQSEPALILKVNVENLIAQLARLSCFSGNEVSSFF